MPVVRFDDARAFRSAVEPLIGASEARHNLAYGILGNLVDDPTASEDFCLWLTDRDGATVAAAVWTPPWNVVVCDATDREATGELAAAIASEPGRPAGVVGNRPTIDWFADAWSGATGDRPELQLEQGVFALDDVIVPPQPPGGPRIATSADVDLVLDWHERFVAEALAGQAVDPDRFGTVVAARIERRRGSGIWLWDDGGEVVSMTAHGNPTPHGMRIGPVYTPPDHRGRGYATALVAHQSARLLAGGRRFCFLYTDLANPTSNAMYRRLGFRQVAEAMQYGFRHGRPRC